jgi:hypothetical protein
MSGVLSGSTGFPLTLQKSSFPVVKRHSSVRGVLREPKRGTSDARGTARRRYRNSCETADKMIGEENSFE